MGELLFPKRLSCLLRLKLIITAYLILMIFDNFVNTNMCHGCHDIFYMEITSTTSSSLFGRRMSKYKTKKAREEVLL